ncbi:MAG: peptidylprolyl isomerase [Planctomycetes bacterium]|nr:peptidylprolyl isomerase [Planctomycetota bacterium]
MLSRQIILASGASLLIAAAALAQPVAPPPESKGTTPAVQIIPVSLKNESIAATVNGEKILVGEVKKILDQKPYPITLTEEQKKSLRQSALDVLIEDALMRQYLTKHVPQVGQTEFDKEVKELTDALTKQKKTLDQFLSESGQTRDQLSKDIVARLQWKVVLQRMCPDEKAKVYYNTNKLFFDKVFVRASHILIKFDAKTTKEQRDKAIESLRVLRNEIVAGRMKFEDAAKKYSECPSKDKGGDIGQFPYKFVVVPEFAATAFSTKVGEVSDVVQTVFGVHIIKVTERTPGEVSSFDALKDTVREVWAQDEDLYQRVLADQRKNGSIKIDLP